MLSIKIRPMKIAICGGGTGGHIFPALAVWQKIKELDPNAEVIWLGSNRLETTILPEYGIQPIDCGWYFQRWPSTPSGLWRTARALTQLFLLKTPQNTAGKHLDTFRPDFVICGGSYVCLPGTLAANDRNLPIYLIEPHPILGRANNWVLPHVKIVYTGFQHLADELQHKNVKALNFGMPMRCLPTDFSRERVLNHYKLNPRFKTILITGGSQGAKVINDFIFNWVENRIKTNQFNFKDTPIQIIHQVGSANIEFGREFAARVKTQSYLPIDFIPDMLQVAAASDVIVSRAGISTSGELSTLGIPVVYIPLPFSAEDHQRKIASAEVEKGRAVAIEQDSLNLDEFSQNIQILLDDDWQNRARINKNTSTNAALEIAKSMIDDHKSNSKE